ncbi:aquaporin (plasmid) [Deinococcus sp. KNUC1210]|uniref:aquaporin n=1 Tax=Deinococcus sp. KNUC1210 TaxID=2917691 RepID=UPI001EF00D0C|nr:aquaporin [Deinococcus sp. KNUC1210]ULH17633.1 aquaporin [Deinococcus sp. KNUC1210]
MAEGLGAGGIVLGDLGALQLAQLGLLPDIVAQVVVPGAMVMVLIYLFSDLSGAHFNPAVSVAFTLRRSLPWQHLPAYLAAQLLGAFLAALLLRGLPAGHEQVHQEQAWLLEGAATLFLVLLVLATATRKATLGPETGLVMGTTVGLAHALIGPLTAVTLNPARALGPALVRGDVLQTWPHWTGPFVGAAVAVALTWLLRGPATKEEAQAAQGHAEGTAFPVPRR